MPDDYTKTALRMGSSSKALHNANEFYNACYLGGYVIECYQKILLKLLGNPGHGHHIPSLINSAETTYLSSSSTIAGQLNRLGVMVNLRADFVYIQSSWGAGERYSGTNSIWNNTMSANYQQEITIALNNISAIATSGIQI